MAAAPQSPRLLFRAFADVESESDAERVCSDLVERLGALGTVRSREVGSYWAMPQWREILLELVPRASPEDALQRMCSALGVGWRARGDASSAAEWMPGPRARFVDRCVRWAGLEVAIALEDA